MWITHFHSISICSLWYPNIIYSMLFATSRRTVKSPRVSFNVFPRGVGGWGGGGWEVDSHSLHPNKKIENLPHNLYKTRIGKLIKCTCMSLQDKPHQPHHALIQIFFWGGGGVSRIKHVKFARGLREHIFGKFTFKSRLRSNEKGLQ